MSSPEHGVGKKNNWLTRCLLGTAVTAWVGLSGWTLVTVVGLQSRQAAAETQITELARDVDQGQAERAQIAKALHRVDRNVARLCEKLGVKYEEPK